MSDFLFHSRHPSLGQTLESQHLWWKPGTSSSQQLAVLNSGEDKRGPTSAIGNCPSRNLGPLFHWHHRKNTATRLVTAASPPSGCSFNPFYRPQGILISVSWISGKKLSFTHPLAPKASAEACNFSETRSWTLAEQQGYSQPSLCK